MNGSMERNHRALITMLEQKSAKYGLNEMMIEHASSSMRRRRRRRRKKQK
jgi:hypothetical protein